MRSRGPLLPSEPYCARFSLSVRVKRFFWASRLRVRVHGCRLWWTDARRPWVVTSFSLFFSVHARCAFFGARPTDQWFFVRGKCAAANHGDPRVCGGAASTGYIRRYVVVARSRAQGFGPKTNASGAVKRPTLTGYCFFDHFCDAPVCAYAYFYANGLFLYVLFICIACSI